MASSDGENGGLPTEVGICRDRYIPGCKQLAKPEAPALELRAFVDAFWTPWETDAHFVTYTPVNTGSTHWPRLTKEVLPRMREAGADVVMTMLVLDYDNPPADPTDPDSNHMPWTPQMYAEFMQRLCDADGGEFPLANNTRKAFPLAMNWTLFYKTAGGARFIYVLTEPVLVDYAEQIHRGLVLAWHDAGFGDKTKGWIDPKCSDWTRLFRLPLVNRDGRNTWEQPYFEMLPQLERRLDPASIAPVENPWGGISGYADVTAFTEPQPGTDCTTLLYEASSTSGALEPSGWYREARRRLKGRDCFPCLFEHAPIATRGSRNNTIHQYVGQAVSCLFQVPGTSPELIYALFYSSVSQLTPDGQTRDWTEVLWQAICKIWTKERSQDEYKRIHDKTYTESAVSATSALLDAVRQWCQDPGILGSESDATAWLYKHLICITPTALHIMRRDGFYDSVAVQRNSLMVRIRELGMEMFMPLKQPNDDGELKPVMPQTLVDRHGTVVRGVEGTAGGMGTIIKDIGREDAVLSVQLYRRKTERELEPTFDPEVDEWLQRLGGKDYDKLCAWLGYALDFEGGPICALSIAGRSGLGKKMLVVGLAECLNTGTFADAKVFGQFQGMLRRTPFVVINEGLSPQDGGGGGDLADTFRMFVSGDPVWVNEKYQEMMLVRSPLRIIMTANNTNVMSMLTGHRDLSPDDRESIAIRIMHIDARQSTAVSWLRNKGGLNFTGRPGRRWISADAGQPGDFILAKHLMWLYVNRPPVRPGARLLVEGDLNDEVMYQMQTRSGSAPVVIETLIRMIESANARDGLVIQDGCIYVTNQAVVQYFRDSLADSMRGVKINHSNVGAVLRGLLVKGQEGIRTLTKPDGSRNYAHFKQIDPQLLLRECVEHGFASRKLREIAEKKFVADMSAHYEAAP